MMTRNPKISIGLPAYSDGLHIRQVLDFLLAQNYGDFERDTES
jgi:glycosyltransferase involved in cell wall biosynthesis